jgi:hypothetical protein
MNYQEKLEAYNESSKKCIDALALKYSLQKALKKS